MSSRKQIEANRRNAQKSTGPVTAQGKASCAQNAFKTGLYAKSLVIPGEKLADLQHLIDDYYRQHRPTSPEQRSVLDDLIMCEWELRRLTAIEASLWNYQISEFFRPVEDEYRTGKAIGQNTRALALIQRRIDSTRRGRDRAIKILRDLVTNPIEPAETPADSVTTSTSEMTYPTIGSVPSASPQPPEEPQNEAPEAPKTPPLPQAA